MIKHVHYLLIAGTWLSIQGCDSGGSSSPVISEPIPIENVTLIDENTINDYLTAINEARQTRRDCGKVNDNNHAVDAEGNAVTNGDRSRYVYDGSNMMGPSKALTWSDALYKAAYEHNLDMANSTTTNLDHTGSGTQYDHTAQVHKLGRDSRFDERIKNNGYTGNLPWRENLTISPDDPKGGDGPTDTAQKAVQKWLESPGHCVNLMDPKIKEVGMSYLHREKGDYTHFWTQDLGGGQ